MSHRAVVVDPDTPGRLAIRPVDDPVPDRGEAIVRVKALSLNRGEVRRAGLAAAGCMLRATSSSAPCCLLLSAR